MSEQSIKPIVKEVTINAPVSKVWKAITDKDEMKNWYFELEEFQPEVGFEFRFYGEDNKCNKFLHICEISEIIHEKNLAHSWRYDGEPGMSYVTWELFPEGDSTRIVLTHTGLETFPDKPMYARESFEGGWNEIIGKLLKEYLEK